MYNPNINPELSVAKFTKLFKDIQDNTILGAFYECLQEEYEDVLVSLEVNTGSGYESLQNELLEKYRYYEICDNEVAVFVQCLWDIFHEYKHEFIQLATNYYKEYNYEVGNRKRTIRRDISEGNRDSTSANTSSNIDKKYDIIISNPPYITDDDMKNLQPEVKSEPATALEGGEDGLTFYRHIAKEYKKYIAPNGTLAFEVGMGEAEAVADIMRQNGYQNVGVRKDYCDVDRVVFGTAV